MEKKIRFFSSSTRFFSASISPTMEKKIRFFSSSTRFFSASILSSRSRFARGKVLELFPRLVLLLLLQLGFREVFFHDLPHDIFHLRTLLLELDPRFDAGSLTCADLAQASLHRLLALAGFLALDELRGLLLRQPVLLHDRGHELVPLLLLLVRDLLFHDLCRTLLRDLGRMQFLLQGTKLLARLADAFPILRLANPLRVPPLELVCELLLHDGHLLLFLLVLRVLDDAVIRHELAQDRLLLRLQALFLDGALRFAVAGQDVGFPEHLLEPGLLRLLVAVALDLSLDVPSHVHGRLGDRSPERA